MSEKELLAKAEAGNASALFLLCQALANGIGALSNAPHPAVEVLDELEAWIDKRLSAFERKILSCCDLSESQAFSAVESVLAELRRAKGV